MNASDIQQLIRYLESSVHFSRHIGLRIESVEPGRTVFSLQVAEMHLNGAGTVHGGVHASLMDSAMAVSLIACKLRVTTTQMNLHYLEPATRGRIVCTAQVMHRARRSAITEAKIHDEAGRLLASATASFRVFELDPAGSTHPTISPESVET
jgi:uncharacterized protein (TIGR00369 family)